MFKKCFHLHVLPGNLPETNGAGKPQCVTNRRARHLSRFLFVLRMCPFPRPPSFQLVYLAQLIKACLNHIRR